MSTNQHIKTAQQWKNFTIKAGSYCNLAPLNGFQIKQEPKGNPLHPDTEAGFEERLLQSFSTSQQALTSLKLKRVHMSMPAINADVLPSAQDYQPIAEPVALASTSISAILVDQNEIQDARIGYHYNNRHLSPLKERLEQQIPYQGICGNLGYFMTRELNCGDLPWAHRRRFPEQSFQLPEILSYLGFYYFNDPENKRNCCGFQGVHPGAIAITKQGKLEILSEVIINSYEVTIAEKQLMVDIINPDLVDIEKHDIALFNTGYSVHHEGALVEFSPMLTLNNRVNIFIANRGNGQQPHEEVIKVWHGESPLPSFGVLISIKEALFNELFAGETLIGSFVDVAPHSNSIDFSQYKQILGGLVPAVINGDPIVPTGPNYNVADAEAALDKVAATASPLAKTGKESNNFDARIREPAGLIIQTENNIGWLLFDGRHELSIGANIVDCSNLITRLQQNDIDLFDGEKIITALVIDGGSAMKVYAVTQSEQQTNMTLLNRVAAGGRNGPGSDEQGLNLYSTATIELI